MFIGSNKIIFCLALSLLIYSTNQINQQCDQNSEIKQCPSNSICNSLSFCQCNPNWVLDCNTFAPILTNQLQTFQFLTQTQNFTILPSNTDDIFVYKFELCIIGGEVELNLSLFADEGIQTDLSKQNLLGERLLRTPQICLFLFSPYMQFGNQPNGKVQQMILQVKFIRYLSLTQNLKNLIKEENPSIRIRVQEMFFMSQKTLFIIGFSFLLVISCSLVIGIAICIHSYRRGTHKGFIDNNLSHFEEFLPKYKAKSGDMQLTKECPVCLIDFEEDVDLRKTPCCHIFHHDCLDLWCKKNLTCPVCRKSLTKESIKRNQEEKEKTILMTNCSVYSDTISQEFEEVLEEGNKKILRQPLN